MQLSHREDVQPRAASWVEIRAPNIIVQPYARQEGPKLGRVQNTWACTTAFCIDPVDFARSWLPGQVGHFSSLGKAWLWLGPEAPILLEHQGEPQQQLLPLEPRPSESRFGSQSV